MDVPRKSGRRDLHAHVGRLELRGAALRDYNLRIVSLPGAVQQPGAGERQEWTDPDPACWHQITIVSIFIKIRNRTNKIRNPQKYLIGNLAILK